MSETTDKAFLTAIVIILIIALMLSFIFYSHDISTMKSSNRETYIEKLVPIDRNINSEEITYVAIQGRRDSNESEKDN